MGVMQDISQTVNKWYVRYVALPVLVASSANAGISALEAIAQDKNKAGVVWAAERKLPYFNGTMIDEVYAQSVPAPEYHPTARMYTASSSVRSKFNSYPFKANIWNKYYYGSGDLSKHLQGLFKNAAAMKSFHDKYLKDPSEFGFSTVWLELEGYLIFYFNGKGLNRNIIVDIGADTARAIKEL